MIFLNDNYIVLDAKDCPDNINFIDFNLKKKYTNNNYALKIDFKNDLKYSILCIKKIIFFQNSNINFSTKYNNFELKYIISNYNDDIITALKAIFITDIKEKYTYIYDSIFNYLDKIWKKNNPCKFCDNICIASRNHKTSHKENGCCYSFDYNNKLFTFNIIVNMKQCKYLNEHSSCSTQNLSCKLFVCNYLRKNKLFEININNILLFQAFFNKKQKLILQYNFFKSKEEIIDKLLEKNNTPFFIYYYNSNYRI